MHSFLTSRRSIPLRILLLIFWLAILAFGGMAQGKISTVTENDPSFFLPESAESTLAGQAARSFQDTTQLPLLVVAVRDDGAALTQSEIGALAQLGKDLPATKIGDGQVLSDVLVQEQIPPIPNEDATAILLPVSLDSAAVNVTAEDGTKVASSVVKAVRAAVAEVGLDGVDIYVSGPAGLSADIGAAFAGIDLTLLLVTVALVAIILVVVYRSLFLPFAVLTTAITALCGAVLVTYQLALRDVFSLNGQTQGILAILVIGATTDYSLLIVARYRDELREAGSLAERTPLAALARAVLGSWEPIAASGGTVIAGLLVLLVSDLSSTASLGPIAAIGIVFSILAALTLLPGMLMLPGNRYARVIFWPAHIPDGTPAPSADVFAGHGIWSRWARVVRDNDRKVWVGALVVLVALAAFAPAFRGEGTSQTEQFVDKPESVVGFEVLADAFPIGSVEPVQVIAPEADASELTARIESIDGVESVTPAAEGAGPAGMPARGGQPGDGQPGEGSGRPPAADTTIVKDGKVLLNVATTMPAGDKSARDVVRAIRDVAAEVSPDTLVGGVAAQALDTQDTAWSDIAKIIPLVLGIITLMLMVLLRSVVAPVLLIVANVLSFASAIGITAIIFNWILDYPGADASVPLYSFVFLVALGIDYTIFLMARVREESGKLGTRDGLLRGLAVTGGVITSAGVVLAATFAALAVIPLLFMVQLAIIVPLGLLLDTFIVRTALIAGLVHDIGDPVWLPRKLHSQHEKPQVPESA
ncbi:MMPL family transporter [Trueperella pyogenes]|uniref:MMPL family transporter n=1 Tax=Trueperella pyogenes TaxID=1661 RepID=UPI001980F501|nr:MMPL family transporter [Trueperella pyogenes]